jgi:hypothetical protein
VTSKQPLTPAQTRLIQAATHHAQYGNPVPVTGRQVAVAERLEARGYLTCVGWSDTPAVTYYELTPG